MKPKSILRYFLCIASSAVLTISSAHAAILTWDAGGGGGAITNGGGAWLGAGLWNDATVAATWTSGDDAIFAGPATAGGAVTLASPTTVGSLTFSPSFTGTYTLGTAGQVITLNNGITMNASSGAATFISPITLGGAQSWTNNSLNNASSSAGSLNLNSTLNLNSNALTIGGTGITSLSGTAGSIVSGSGGINVTGGRTWLGSGATPAHTYSGDTSITGGAVVMIGGNASANSNININGGVLESYWTTGLSRTIGTGATQIRITGGESGFGMNGSNGATFTLGALTWGDTNFNPTKLLLQTQYSQGTSSLVLASAIDLSGADRTVVAHQGVAGTATSAISGNITTGTGTAGLIKEGLGVLTLTGASNTYNGGTTISAGTLAFDKIAAMPSTGVVAVNNATLGIDLGGGGDWTGSSTVAVGTLGGLLGGLGGAGTSTVTYTGNVGLRLTLTGNTTYSGDIANVGTSLALTKAGTSTLTLTGTNNSYTGPTSILAGQLTLDGSLTGGGAISTTAAGVLFQSGTGVISGASSFTQNSSGASTLSGNNSYTGGTTLAAGTLTVGHANALGTGTIALNVGTLQSSDATARSFTNAVTLGGNFTVGGSGNLTFSNTGASALGATRTITVNSGINATFAQAFSGSGFGITKAGTGTLTLNGTNTYTGATTFAAGTLKVVGSSALASTSTLTNGAANATLHLQRDSGLTVSNPWSFPQRNFTNTIIIDRETAGAAVDWTVSGGLAQLSGNTMIWQKGANVTSGTPTVDLSGGIPSTDSTAGTIKMVAESVNLRINNISNTRVRTNELAGDTTGNEVYGIITQNNSYPSGLLKSGTGTWTLSGATHSNANAYSNGTTVTGGILNTTKATALSKYNTAGKVIINGGTLGVRVGGAGWATTEVDTMLTNATKTSGALGIDTTNGNLTQWTPFAGGGNFGALGLTKLGGNILTLDQANTYTGATTVNAGTLKLGADNVLPETNVTIGSATLDADTFDDTLGTLDAAGSAVINLGSGANLVFADSSLVDWTGGTLNITGAFVSGSSLNFGVGGLSPAQLAAITINGVPGSYTLDGSGFLSSGVGPGPLDNFLISAISSPQTVGTPITGITLTARDASNATITSFTGTVNFGGTGGFTGTSASFTAGVLSGVSVTPTTAGSGLTFTVTDIGSGKTGSATITTIQTQYAAWSGGAAFDADANGDGVENGLAWLLGAANKDDNAIDLLPEASENAGALILNFRCLKVAGRGGVSLAVQYSNDLGITDTWNSAVVPDGDSTVNNVVFDTTDDGAFINVEATIPVGESSAGKLFGRLNTESAP